MSDFNQFRVSHTTTTHHRAEESSSGDDDDTLGGGDSREMAAPAYIAVRRGYFAEDFAKMVALLNALQVGVGIPPLPPTPSTAIPVQNTPCGQVPLMWLYHSLEMLTTATTYINHLAPTSDTTNRELNRLSKSAPMGAMIAAVQPKVADLLGFFSSEDIIAAGVSSMAEGENREHERAMILSDTVSSLLAEWCTAPRAADVASRRHSSERAISVYRSMRQGSTGGTGETGIRRISSDRLPPLESFFPQFRMFALSSIVNLNQVRPLPSHHHNPSHTEASIRTVVLPTANQPDRAYSFESRLWSNSALLVIPLVRYDEVMYSIINNRAISEFRDNFLESTTQFNGVKTCCEAAGDPRVLMAIMGVVSEPDDADTTTNRHPPLIMDELTHSFNTSSKNDDYYEGAFRWMQSLRTAELRGAMFEKAILRRPMVGMDFIKQGKGSPSSQHRQEDVEALSCAPPGHGTVNTSRTKISRDPLVQAVEAAMGKKRGRQMDSIATASEEEDVVSTKCSSAGTDASSAEEAYTTTAIPLCQRRRQMHYTRDLVHQHPIPAQQKQKQWSTLDRLTAPLLQFIFLHLTPNTLDQSLLVSKRWARLMCLPLAQTINSTTISSPAYRARWLLTYQLICCRSVSQQVDKFARDNWGERYLWMGSVHSSTQSSPEYNQYSTPGAMAPPSHSAILESQAHYFSIASQVIRAPRDSRALFVGLQHPLDIKRYGRRSDRSGAELAALVCISNEHRGLHTPLQHRHCSLHRLFEWIQMTPPPTYSLLLSANVHALHNEIWQQNIERSGDRLSPELKEEVLKLIKIVGLVILSSSKPTSQTRT